VSLIQSELSQFLQYEMQHTLGCYGEAARGLSGLEDRVSRRRRDTDTIDKVLPDDAIVLVKRYNEALRTQLSVAERARAGTDPPSAHPNPERTLDGGEVRDRWVLDCYETVAACLKSYKLYERERAPRRLSASEQLGKIVREVDDPQRKGMDLGMSTARRIKRTKWRAARACELLGQETGRNRTDEILADFLLSPKQDQLHTHAIGALVDAHFCMHKAEHLASVAFREKFTDQQALRRAIEIELNRSIVLNTFVYVVGRAMPWIFSESPDERDFVIEKWPECSDRMAPTYCMWIGNQLSMLALHRRGFTHMLWGRGPEAYNDFLKLRLYARSLQRQLTRSVAKAPGVDEFLLGLDAFADHHSGRIYRRNHAHLAAIRHLNRAARSLDKLEAIPEFRGVLQNSRWRIELFISQGKAYYELGHFSQCLRRYAEAWRAFLELADSESQAIANFEMVDALIGWLGVVETDTAVDKVELCEKLEPLVAQIRMVRGPVHLRTIAAEIMMRLGHILFIMRLPVMTSAITVKRRRGNEAAHLKGERRAKGTQSSTHRIRPSDRYPVVDHRLARECIAQAAKLNPVSTLIASNLSKFDYWSEEVSASSGDERVSLAEQWPGGGGGFDEVARVVEYVLQRWLSETFSKDHEWSPRESVARRLLGGFLVHTDSSNTKHAQVYHYLMREPSTSPEVRRVGLELLCLRRYSSFFPFVPRPAAFRVMGGGYLVRVHGDGSDAMFGVAIDPGPSFIENLYRAGGCLAEVHMVVLTHDHADHIAELDAMLALLGYRAKYGATTFCHKQKLCIVGNESVKTRYGFFNNEDRKDTVLVLSFEEWESENSKPGRGRLATAKRCDGLYLKRVESADHVDAGGNPSQAFILGVRAGRRKARILFTGDTGLPPSLGGGSDDSTCADGMLMRDALKTADVVVAHVSAAPLPELRRLADFDVPAGDTKSWVDEFEEIWREVAQVAASHEARASEQRAVLKQVQAGFYSLPEKELVSTELEELSVSPLSESRTIREPSERHLYLSGILSVAEAMKERASGRLLLIGELREELGTFRTRIAAALNADVLKDVDLTALTTDVGLKVRVNVRSGKRSKSRLKVWCNSCELDNDLVEAERLWKPSRITEVCVKGENEAIVFNCPVHEPLAQEHPQWVERMERFDPFGR
jgi:tetratricopeptide (TPR) repeat protein